MLSGEHVKMAQTEVLALLETYSISYSSPMLDERIILVSIAQNNSLGWIGQRAAFSHSNSFGRSFPSHSAYDFASSHVIFVTGKNSSFGSKLWSGLYSL